jgi:ribosomal protein S27E
MRVKLGAQVNQGQQEFIATVQTLSQISETKKTNTIMLTELKDINNNIITDHIWMPETKTIADANLDRGDIIQFHAQARKYIKKNGALDYKISYVSGIKKIGRDSKLQPIKRKLTIYEETAKRRKKCLDNYRNWLSTGYPEDYNEDVYKKDLKEINDTLKEITDNSIELKCPSCNIISKMYPKNKSLISCPNCDKMVLNPYAK